LLGSYAGGCCDGSWAPRPSQQAATKKAASAAAAMFRAALPHALRAARPALDAFEPR
jgi:hypothetical protein